MIEHFDPGHVPVGGYSGHVPLGGDLGQTENIPEELHILSGVGGALVLPSLACCLSWIEDRNRMI